MTINEYIILKGMFKWVRYLKPDVEYNKYSVTLYPDATSLETIRELQSQGMKNVLKKDDDGYFVRFGRVHSREYKGKIITLGPPEIINSDGTPYTGPAIGNGSSGSIKLEVYTHNVPGSKGKAKASRWVALKVDTLIPFEGERDFTETEEKAVRNLTTATPPAW
jgi:hypothetical protein